ncbi:MAG: hypothetical protein KAR87_00815 [Candidatus Aenigmarchaeota archaeon]|nr:hypothetical protein [Candidatus Aenigmarchaeota archaeon]
MEKNIYLSKKEQEVFNVLRDLKNPVIEHDQLKDVFQHNKYLNKTISSLIRKKYFLKIKKGLYLIQKEPSDKINIDDIYAIALRIKKGYFAFSTALRLHNLMEYEPFTIYIATSHKPEEIKISNYLIKAVNYTKIGNITTINKYPVSTKEKTFFDCFNKPQYCGGFYQITNALYSTRINWKILLTYFKKHASNVLCQKTGYILEQMKEKTNYEIPNYVINYLKTRIKNKVYLIAGQKGGKYNKEWKLTDNDRNFLKWYYG